MVALFAILALLSLGFYLQGGRRQMSQAQTSPPYPTPAPSKNTPASPASSNTQPSASSSASWKSYRNEQYAFELNYPSDWEINYRNKFTHHESYPVVTFISLATKSEIKRLIAGGGVETPGPDIIISVEELKDSISLEDYLYTHSVHTHPSLGDVVSYKKARFAGNDAYEVILGGFGKNYSIDIEKHNKRYEILFENKGERTDLSLTEKQILDSFNFLD